MTIVTDLDRVDWSTSSSVHLTTGQRTALQWARAVFEQSPAPVRIFLRLSWRYLLLIQLGPAHGASNVLGWRIVEQTDERVMLGSHSRFGLETRLVLTVTAGRLTFDTALRQANRWSHMLWLVVGPVHRIIVRMLLKAAARR